MKVSLDQNIAELPKRYGSIILGLGIYWDFGRRNFDGKRKLYGSIHLDILIWSLVLRFRGGI